MVPTFSNKVYLSILKYAHVLGRCTSQGSLVCGAAGTGIGGAGSISTSDGSISGGAGLTTPGVSLTFSNNSFDKYYYRARYLDPNTGRFLSEDLIGFKSWDLNFYRLVKNNPLIFTDPFGKDMRTEANGGTDGYFDVGITVGTGVVGTVGVQTGSGITCIYIGAGAGTTGAYATLFPKGAPSPGGSVCGAAGAGVGGAGSISTSDGSISGGAGLTTPGVSLTFTNNVICF